MLVVQDNGLIKGKLLKFDHLDVIYQPGHLITLELCTPDITLPLLLQNISEAERGDACLEWKQQKNDNVGEKKLLLLDDPKLQSHLE